MWLIKLPFRIIALPIMAIVAVFSIFYSLFIQPYPVKKEDFTLENSYRNFVWGMLMPL